VTELSLADIAASFLMQVVDDPDADVGAISSKLFDSANLIASKVNAMDFVMLAKEMNVISISKSAIVAREVFDIFISKRDFDSAGALACVHLMALNLVDGLKDADAAKEASELAAHLYSQQYAVHAQEYAYRKIAGRELNR
jgi:hypothetical protein